MISLIVAVADNNVIGMNNAIPWHAPADLSRFKQLTMGKPMVMGRKTFESLGRVLPGRPHVIISRQANPQWPEQCHAAGSLPAALQTARELAGAGGEIMVIGGAEIYAQALPLAHRIYLTRVHTSPEGDAWLVPIDPAHWRETERSEAAGEPACTYITYERIPC